MDRSIVLLHIWIAKTQLQCETPRKSKLSSSASWLWFHSISFPMAQWFQECWLQGQNFFVGIFIIYVWMFLVDRLLVPWDHTRTELALLCGLETAKIMQVRLCTGMARQAPPWVWQPQRHRSLYCYQSHWGCAHSAAKSLMSVWWCVFSDMHGVHPLWNSLQTAALCCAHLKTGLTTFQNRSCAT